MKGVISLLHDFSKLDALIAEGEGFFTSLPRPVPMKLWTKRLQAQEQKDGNTQDTLIAQFLIPEPETLPLFLQSDDKAALNQVFQSALQELQEYLYNLEEDLDDDNTCESIESMCRQMDRLKRQYDTHTRGNLEGAVTSSWLKAMGAFIEGIIPAVYNGLSAAEDNVYELILREVNNFLRQNGIFTKEIQVGEKLDTNDCEFVEDSSAVTKDPRQSDVIVKIRQYPYLTVCSGERILIKSGKAVAWRYDG